ncbi:hypothetical protein DXG01_010908 [Tephrocybe rancida]|nr:hypothetical protein DXG01_010908 [Tephrocybe rancida]
MGEVTYYEHEWEKQLARLYLGSGPTAQPEVSSTTIGVEQTPQASSGPDVIMSYVPQEGHKGIDDLPTELLCKIFEHTVSNSTPISATGYSTPATLSQVSQKWRSVTNSTPWLWNDVLIDCADWSDMPRLIHNAHAHLQRCGDLPISIRTMGSSDSSKKSPKDDLAIQALMAPYAGRIRHLTLSLPVVWMNNFLRHTANPADVQFLESLKLVYHPSKESPHLSENNLFTHAHALRKVEFEYVSEMGWKYLEANTVNLPWEQLTELNLIHVVATPSYLQSILVKCVALEKCTLSIIKAVDEIPHHHLFFVPPPPTLAHVNLPSIRHLTLYNPKNFDYTKYLAGLRIHFPSLEHFSVSSSGDPRNGRQWSQSQFEALISENTGTIRSVSTPAHISDVDIESVIGEVRSLVELDVSEGDNISETTVRLMTQGYLAPALEVLKCAVAPDMLSSFLDMVEGRYVSRKSKAKYRGFKTLVIRCPKDSDGYREVHERVEDLQQCGRDITVMDSFIDLSVEQDWASSYSERPTRSRKPTE